MSDIREQLAAALREHDMVGGTGGRGVFCRCGWVGPGSEHRAHVVVSVLPLVVGYGNQRAAEALEKAAENCAYTPLSERSAHEGGLSDFTKGWHAAGAYLSEQAASLRAVALTSEQPR